MQDWRWLCLDEFTNKQVRVEASPSAQYTRPGVFLTVRGFRDNVKAPEKISSVLLSTTR